MYSAIYKVFFWWLRFGSWLRPPRKWQLAFRLLSSPLSIQGIHPSFTSCRFHTAFPAVQNLSFIFCCLISHYRGITACCNHIEADCQSVCCNFTLTLAFRNLSLSNVCTSSHYHLSPLPSPLSFYVQEKTNRTNDIKDDVLNIRRKLFEKFAYAKGGYPMDPNFWYSLDPAHLLKFKVNPVSIFYNSFILFLLFILF